MHERRATFMSALHNTSFISACNSFWNLVDLNFLFLLFWCENESDDWPPFTTRYLMKATQSVITTRAADSMVAQQSISVLEVRCCGHTLRHCRIVLVERTTLLLSWSVLSYLVSTKRRHRLPRHRSIEALQRYAKFWKHWLGNRWAPFSCRLSKVLFTAGVSPICTALFVQELQNDAADNGAALYIANLDTKSEFDTVHVDTVINALILQAGQIYDC